MLVALEQWIGATLVQSGGQAMIRHLVLTAFLAPFCAFLSKRDVCVTMEIRKGLRKKQTVRRSMEPLIVYLKNTTNTTNELSFSHFFNKLEQYATLKLSF
jgi:hypothetical protein